MTTNDQLVAVVTGASRGLGRGIARGLAERGATVYVAGRPQVSGTQKSPVGAPLPVRFMRWRRRYPNEQFVR